MKKNIKLEDIAKLLDMYDYTFGKYEIPSDREYYFMEGRKELHKEILNILNR